MAHFLKNSQLVRLIKNRMQLQMRKALVIKANKG